MAGSLFDPFRKVITSGYPVVDAKHEKVMERLHYVILDIEPLHSSLCHPQHSGGLMEPSGRNEILQGFREEEITFPGSDRDLRAVLIRARSFHDRFPAVIVIHEVDGLNENIKRISRRFAKHGYAALAVDLFTGRSKPLCMAQILYATLRGSLDSFGVRDLIKAIDFLQHQNFIIPERIGAIGFCLGGGFSIALACRDRRIKVIAPFYGANPSPIQAVERSCPVVGSYPKRDFTARSGRNLKIALDQFKIPNDIKIYPGARHSFMNDSSRAFDPVASEDAMNRTMAFFDQYLMARSPGAVSSNGLKE
jgi:carboxymethylenebutenolidase